MEPTCQASNTRQEGWDQNFSLVPMKVPPLPFPLWVRLLRGRGGDSRGARGWWAWPAWRRGQVAQPVLLLTPHFSHPQSLCLP